MLLSISRTGTIICEMLFLRSLLLLIMPGPKSFSRSYKPAIFLLISAFLYFSETGISEAQILKPIRWTSSVKQANNKEAELIIKPVIDKNWHIYGQNIDGEGPIPTSIAFEPSDNYELAGKTIEIGSHEEMDATWGFKVTYLSDGAFFRQKIRIKTDQPFEIKCTVGYQICDDKMCLPPDDVVLKFSINKGAGQNADKEKAGMIPKDSVLSSGKDSLSSADEISVPDTAMTAAGTGLEPGCGETAGGIQDYTSLIGILIGGLLGGFLALLTPCVFPMIPMTVSFFTKRSTNRKQGRINALLYAMFIILIYVGLGFLVTVTLGSDALNALASNSFFNILFFFIFVIFALSFFGAFEIVLPSSWINKADHAAERGGIIGIFFMAFTLSLVSFSCTGPIIGTLLVEAAHGRSYAGPLVGMTGFAVALALPFAFFAAFPGWLNSLPKSGGWLNTVKVSLGFLELALALKFLSNVDLAYHWGFLKREIFIAFWVVIFGLLGLYLLGRLRFEHDSEVQHIGVGRLIFALFSLTFTLYLIPGIWGAPLKLISGFPPPEFYKEWITKESSGHCPHNLNCFHDYKEGLAYAKTQGKPVMVDFTGWSCVNCRKMEDNVWSDPEVLKRLSEKYVLISLYVDDKTELPPGEQYESKVLDKNINTTGRKWSDLQASVYQTNSQPYYVLLDHKEKLLAKPRGYTPDIPTYIQFLDEGLCRFEKRKK